MYYIGVDVGGTFTDCVVLDGQGRVVTAKSDTTARDLRLGIRNVLGVVAGEIGISVEDLLTNTTQFIHGCTTATNAMIQRTGAKVGVITTKGHEDTIFIGRVYQKVAGLSERDVTHVSKLHKASPLVDRDCVKGITERLDYKGRVVIPLDPQELGPVMEDLVSKGVEAIAICLLWSFMSPDHELRVKEFIAERYPGMYIATSESVPVIGEYERMVTTVLNAYVGPKIATYVRDLENDLRSLGYSRRLLLMHAGGGLATVEEVQRTAALMLDSGPAGGCLGSRYFGKVIGEQNIICTDVGGTSFDVSLVHQGDVQLESRPIIGQYQFLAEKVLISSIGSGGGSKGWKDIGGVLKVGPLSAEAVPGPACYDRGGLDATTTDANLLLGYYDADSFLGGRMKLNKNKALEAMQRLADAVGMDVMKTASGMFTILNSQMADLIRKVTIERGFDPRDFVLFAFGGAGPTHAAFYAAEAGAKVVYIPTAATAFSALGMLCSDVVVTLQASRPTQSPFGPEAIDTINQVYAELEDTTLSRFEASGVSKEKVEIEKWAYLRWGLQVHELAIPMPKRALTAEDGEWIERTFKETYEATYGKDTAFTLAGMEVLRQKTNGIYRALAVEFQEEEASPKDPRDILRSVRDVYFEKYSGFVPTSIYDGSRLRAGHRFEGPCIIERVGDTIVVPPELQATVDGFGNVVIPLG